MASKPKSSSRSRAVGSTSTPEYLTIRECYPHLVSVVKDSYDTIGDRLFSKGYVSRKIRNFIRMDSKMPTEKAQKLLDTILDRIVYHPNVFNDFIEILEKEGLSTNDLVRELREVYKTKGVCVVEPSPDQNVDESDCDSKGYPSVDSSSEDSFHSTTDQPASTHEQPGFVCLCGECSSEQFFSEKGCPKAEQKKLFPFLDVVSLDDADKIDLEQRLISDTRKMVTKFASFTSYLEKSLQTQKIPLEEVASRVLSLQAFTEDIGQKLLEKNDEEAIQQAKSVPKIFMVLYPYISFFNYEIMEHLVKHHGSPDDHKRLEEYLTAFTTFCQRSVFEVPPNVYSSRSRTDCKVFAAKCTESVATTLEGVRGVRGKIADVLGLRASSLQLCSVRKGCMELHFRISTAVSNQIFPVSPAKQLALNQIGVRISERDKDEDIEDQLRFSHGKTQTSVLYLLPSQEQQLLPSQEAQLPLPSLLSVEGKPPTQSSFSQEGQPQPPSASSQEGQPQPPSASSQEGQPQPPSASSQEEITTPSSLEKRYSRLQIKRQMELNLQFFLACKRGSLSEVISLIERGASIHSTAKSGRTPLIAACEGGHSATAQFLIEKGADLNKQDRFGRTPLIAACEGGHSATAQMLIEKGADLSKYHGRLRELKALEVAKRSNVPNLVTILEKTVELTHRLMDACKRGSPSEVSVLLKQGASVHRRSDQGMTPLIVACGGGHSETAQLLIEEGADLSKLDWKGRTPLIAACEGGHSATAQLLIKKGADVNKQDMSGRTPLIAACEGAHSATAQLLFEERANLNDQDWRGRTPLIAACEGGHSETAQLLIEKAADFNKQDWREKTPLIAACEGGHSSTVQLLIEKAADWNKQDRRGRTPLIAACEGGHFETAQLLIEKGADLNEQGKHKRTPLIAACEGGHSETVQFLIENGADLSKQDARGRTPLIAACEKGHSESAMMLIEKGANLNKQDGIGRTPLIDACRRGHSETAQLLIEKGAYLNEQDRWGTTPLIAACGRGHSETARLLIEKGADLNKGERTPLIAACEGGHSATAQLLIERGADLNKHDTWGMTPLIAACVEGQSETARLLIENGADLNEKRLSGEPALSIARCKRLPEIEKLLVKYGAKEVTHAGSHHIAYQRRDQLSHYLYSHLSLTSSGYGSTMSSLSSVSSGYGSSMFGASRSSVCSHELTSEEQDPMSSLGFSLHPLSTQPDNKPIVVPAVGDEWYVSSHTFDATCT